MLPVYYFSDDGTCFKDVVPKWFPIFIIDKRNDWEVVAPREIPDFTDLTVHQVVSFMREAKFETLAMKPFLQEYYPDKLNKDGSNQSLVEARKAHSLMGNAYLARYLYQIQSKKELERNLPI